MTIDDSGEFWTGTEFVDVVTYLEELEPGGYPVHRVIEAKCACGTGVFRVHLERDDELAQTECTACGVRTFVADSERHWKGDDVETLQCSCGSDRYEVGLGLSIRDDAWVRWGSVGVRCVACGTLGSPIDWKSDLDLTEANAVRVASADPVMSWEGSVDE